MGKAAEIEDRIPHDLAGAVESDITTAIAFEELYAALLQEFRRGDNVGGLGVAAQRDDRLMFQQEQDVADLFFLVESNQLLLQLLGGGIVDGAELDDGNQILFARSTDSHGSESKSFTTENTEKCTGASRKRRAQDDNTFTRA